MFRKPASISSNAMKLGGKSRDVDSFVDQLKEEGENVASLTQTVSINKIVPTTPAVATEP